MKQLFLIILLLVLKSGILFGQHNLTIEIASLENSEGQIILELMDENEKRIKGITKEIKGAKCIVVIKNLKPGKYSFKYFHDENSNSELDTNWIGIPSEGYGFSNNATGTFGPPDFEETIFEVKGDVTQKCNPTYI